MFGFVGGNMGRIDNGSSAVTHDPLTHINCDPLPMTLLATCSKRSAGTIQVRPTRCFPEDTERQDITVEQ